MRQDDGVFYKKDSDSNKLNRDFIKTFIIYICKYIYILYNVGI